MQHCRSLSAHLLPALLLLASAGVALPALAAGGQPGSKPEQPPQKQLTQNQTGKKAEAASGENRERIETIVREYILEHPEIIEEAILLLQSRQQASRENARKQALAQHRAAIFHDPLSPVSGSAASQADVTIVEFFDYQCGYCRASFGALKKILDTDPRIRVVWKEFPILGPVSGYAARAAMAAREQGKYLELHSALMASRGRLSEAKVLELAASVGLDLDRLGEDMKNPEISAHFADTRRIAEALQINGTPAFVIGEKLIDGALDEAQLQQLIAAARGES